MGGLGLVFGVLSAGWLRWVLGGPIARGGRGGAVLLPSWLFWFLFLFLMLLLLLVPVLVPVLVLVLALGFVAYAVPSRFPPVLASEPRVGRSRPGQYLPLRPVVGLR